MECGIVGTGKEVLGSEFWVLSYCGQEGQRSSEFWVLGSEFWVLSYCGQDGRDALGMLDWWGGMGAVSQIGFLAAVLG